MTSPESPAGRRRLGRITLQVHCNNLAFEIRDLNYRFLLSSVMLIMDSAKRLASSTS